MKRFREIELNENLEEFKEESTIEIEFEKGIEGKVTLENATINYDYKRGYINIESQKGEFKINTTLVYEYKKGNNEIHIDLDSILLKIKK